MVDYSTRILNPLSGRYVSIKGRIGKQIIRFQNLLPGTRRSSRLLHMKAIPYHKYL